MTPHAARPPQSAFRFSDEIRWGLKRLASADRRTMAAEVEWLIQQEIQRRPEVQAALAALARTKGGAS